MQSKNAAGKNAGEFGQALVARKFCGILYFRHGRFRENAHNEFRFAATPLSDDVLRCFSLL